MNLSDIDEQTVMSDVTIIILCYEEQFIYSVSKKNYSIY